MDSYGKKAGKGALIQEELSGTLGASQDQYLFQPMVFDKYNQTVDSIAPTLKAVQGGDDINIMFQPVTFEPGIAAREGGHIYEGVSGTLRAKAGDNQMTVAYDIGEARLRNPKEYVEQAPTLTARCGTGGNNTPAVVFENHAQDSRFTGPLEKAQPVTATYGTGGNNQPLVVFSKVRRAQDKDDFETWKESNVTNTKNTFDMGDVRATDVVVCLEGNGSRPTHQGDGYRESDTMCTLNTIERHAVAYSIGFMRQLGGVETKEDISPTLQAANGESGNNTLRSYRRKEVNRYE